MQGKVTNLNVHDFTDKFKGKVITIPAGESITMPYDEAIMFKSKYYPPEWDGNNVQKPTSYKMIRVEKLEDGIKEAKGPPEFRCQACDFVSSSKAGLATHTRIKHVNQMIDDDAREQMMKE